jgi:hypothetical protein
MPTLFRVLHGPSYRHLRNHVNGTLSFEVVGHHLKRLMVDRNFAIRIGSGSERRDSAADWRVTRGKAAACANWAPDGFPRGVGAQFLRKTAIFLSGSPPKWLGAYAGFPTDSLSCEACWGEDAGWLRLPWVR